MYNLNMFTEISNDVYAIRDEKAHLAETTEALEGTEGFSKLNRKQQRIIKFSLYVNARNKRRDGALGYDESRFIVGIWNCHNAVDLLERETWLEEGEPPKLPENFFKADYEKSAGLTGIALRIERYGFPAVVHIFSKDPKGDYSKGIYDAEHSFLALGHDINDDVLIWEKVGHGHDFQVSTLSNVFDSYDKDTYYWGVRNLKLKKVKNKTG